MVFLDIIFLVKSDHVFIQLIFFFNFLFFSFRLRKRSILVNSTNGTQTLPPSSKRQFIVARLLEKQFFF